MHTRHQIYSRILLACFLFSFISGCQAKDSTAKILHDTFKVEHDFTIYQRYLGSEQPNYDGLNDPIIFIQAVDPVRCEDPGTGNDYKQSISTCTFLKPLPQSLTLRYGKWLTPNEVEKQFPEPPYTYYRQREPKEENYKTPDEWGKALDSYWQQVEQLPEFKAYHAAKAESIEKIQWHTITIHPKDMMDKYKDKAPYEEVKSF